MVSKESLCVSQRLRLDVKGHNFARRPDSLRKSKRIPPLACRKVDSKIAGR